MTSLPSPTTWADQMRMEPLSSSESRSKTARISGNNGNDSDPLKFNIASFNMLAESYLSPRSHPGLPPSYAEVAFDTLKRRQLLVDTLKRFCCPPSANKGDSQWDHVKWDILALQELDLLAPNEHVLPALSSWGYQVVRTPTDQRRDCCAVVFDTNKFRLVEYEIVKFDDLATLRTKRNDKNLSTVGSNKILHYATDQFGSTYNTMKPNASFASELTGMVRSFLRRNCAIIAHLETRTDKPDSGNEDSNNESRSFIVASAHLYWHPGYEYVKLCQSKYLLERAYAMASRAADGDRIPTIICGDMNSKPGSIVHQFFAEGTVDARTVAPWHYFWDGDHEVIYNEEEEEKYAIDRVDGQDPILSSVGDLSQDDNDVRIGAIDSNVGNNHNVHQKVSDLQEQFCGLIVEPRTVDYDTTAEASNQNIQAASPSDLKSCEVNHDSNYTDLQETLASRRWNNHKSPQDYQHLTPTPNVKYMLDFTLNRFTRWLRILGIDAALETDEEERERTQGQRIALFERCKKEKRTLITTSYKLLLRKDCPPGAYLLDPKSTSHLEQSLPRLLRTHGVELSPCIFLTRCVVCNGIIHPVLTDDEKRSVFLEHGAPDLVDSKDDMEVFRCDGCRQGYWWDDRPASSASRVFTQATKLFRLCLRGGVKIKHGSLFGENNIKEVMGAFDFIDVEKERRYWELDGERGEEDLAVIEWLREAKLSNPFHLRSAYCANADGETSIFHSPRESLPFSNVTSEFVGLLDYLFYEQNEFEQAARLCVPISFREMNTSSIPRGHLLPSNIWPSDHLAVGAQLRLKEAIKSTKSVVTKEAPPSSTQMIHPTRCSCGCVPNIFSLFEMAELRKKARDAAKVTEKRT